MTLLIGLDLPGNTQQILHVMSNLMRDHICLGEVPRRPESIAKILEETHVEVDLLIERTVERTHCRLRKSASRVDRTREQDKLGFPVRFTCTTKQIGPSVLGIGQNCRNELFGFLARRGCRCRTVCGHSTAGIDDFAWIKTEIERK